MALELMSEQRGWELVDPSKDIRGRMLVDSRGRQHGRVTDMLVNTREQRVDSVCTDTGRRFPVEPLEIRENEVIMHDEDAVPASTPMCGVVSVIRGRPSHIVAGDDLRKTTIHGVDGEIGKLSDVYFDDDRWIIRYFVVRTSKTWLLGRKVLIAPDAVVASDNPAEKLNLNLTRDQIRHSPDIDTDRPVSRQQQSMLAAYYGWPGAGIGMIPGGFVGPSYTYTGAHYAHAEGALAEPPTDPDADPHLRSAKEVMGYRVRAGDRVIGDMKDLVYDLSDKTVRSLVLETGERIAQISVQAVEDIRWADRVVIIRRA